MAGVAQTVGTERVEDRVVPEGRGVIAAEADFTEVAHRLTVERRLKNFAFVVPVSALTPPSSRKPAYRPPPRSSVPLEAELAAVDTVLAHRQTARRTIVLDVPGVQVNGAVQGDGRLSRCHTSESAQNCESEQRFFHCNYLLG